MQPKFLLVLLVVAVVLGGGSYLLISLPSGARTKVRQTPDQALRQPGGMPVDESQHEIAGVQQGNRVTIPTGGKAMTAHPPANTPGRQAVTTTPGMIEPPGAGQSTPPLPAGHPVLPKGHPAVPSGHPQLSAGGMPPAESALLQKAKLVQVFRGIGRLETEGKTPLTPAQAKRILAIITPLRSQKTLPLQQTTQVLANLQSQLTPLQRNAIFQPAPGVMSRQPAGNMPSHGMGKMSPHDAGQGSLGGMPPHDGAMKMPPEHGNGTPGGMSSHMAEMNPFYSQSDNPTMQQMAQRWQPIYDELEVKANQSK